MSLPLALLALTSVGCSRSAPSVDGGEVQGQPGSARASSPTRSLPLVELSVDERVGRPDLSHVVWRRRLETPIHQIHVTPESQVVAIGTSRITTLDRRGRVVWFRNIAPQDRVLAAGSCLYVRLSSSERVICLDDRGADRWEREVAGTLTPMNDGTLLASDAASIRALECATGRERWMFSPDRIRSLRFVGSNDETLSLLGEHGTRRSLFTLSRSGALLRRIELPASTVTTEVHRPGEILARGFTELVVLDEAGRDQWRQPIDSRTEIAVHHERIVLARGRADGRIETRVFGQNGRVEAECLLDVGAEPVSVRIVGVEGFPLVLAACAGALSSCAEGGLVAGPFNRLWTCDPNDGSVTKLISNPTERHFDIGHRAGVVVVAVTSPDGRETQVVQLGPGLERYPLVRLRGRRMLGPIAGPGDLWLVALCHGLRCEEPWTLLAISPHREDR